MNFSDKINGILGKTNGFGQLIKFPRLKRNKYYAVDSTILIFKGFEKDLACFQTLQNEFIYMNRRNINGRTIEYLGELINKKENGLCVDFFKNSKAEESMSSVLRRLKIRELTR